MKSFPPTVLALVLGASLMQVSGCGPAAQDMNRSKTGVSVKDARAHALDLTMKRTP